VTFIESFGVLGSGCIRRIEFDLKTGHMNIVSHDYEEFSYWRQSVSQYVLWHLKIFAVEDTLRRCLNRIPVFGM
jgi:hypothetical protein